MGGSTTCTLVVSVSACAPLPRTSHRRWICRRKWLDPRESKMQWTAEDLNGFPGPSRTTFWKFSTVRRNIPPGLYSCKHDIPNTGDTLDCRSPVQSLFSKSGPSALVGRRANHSFLSAPIFEFYGISDLFSLSLFPCAELAHASSMTYSSHSGPIRVSIMYQCTSSRPTRSCSAVAHRTRMSIKRGDRRRSHF